MIRVPNKLLTPLHSTRNTDATADTATGAVTAAECYVCETTTEPLVDAGEPGEACLVCRPCFGAAQARRRD